MQTIEQIKVEQTIIKKHKDENGVVTEVPETKMVVRNPVLVDKGVRFGYYLIDLVFVYILAFIIGIITAITGSGSIWEDPILSRICGALIIVGYYFLIEVTLGTSLGKLMLGYTVIDQYAEKPKAMSTLGRSFARVVPFEAFSCFSERGWHDSWSNTYVVKNSEKAELQRLLGKVSDSDIID